MADKISVLPKKKKKGDFENSWGTCMIPKN